MGVSEFQAVVMAAGRGSRMAEITRGFHKCLLPVGNMPLIWYPLTMLKRNGFKEVTVVILEGARKELVDLQRKMDLTLDIVTINANEDWGTAETLHHLITTKKVVSDLLIVSCDLITDYPLHHVADVHRSHDASLTILLSKVPSEFKEGPTPGHKGKHRQERDIIGLETGTNRLMLLNSEADFEEQVPFRTSVLMKHPNFRVFSNLSDAHLYIMKKSILDDFITGNISTIKGELLPVLISKQFSSKKKKERNETPTDTNNQNTGIDYEELIQLYSTKPFNPNKYSIECYGHIAEEHLCLRVNTLATYVEVNKQIMKFLPLFLQIAQKVTTPSTPKSQVGTDCLIDETTRIGEKVFVKHSNIGRECDLKDKVKITSCVVMDKVVIEEGSSLQGCIVCSGVHIGKQCKLKDCIIGEGQQVGDFADHTNDVIQESDELMEI